MLLQRFDVTMQALLWSPKLAEAGTTSEATADLKARRLLLTAEPARVGLSDLFAAGPEAVRVRHLRVCDLLGGRSLQRTHLRLLVVVCCQMLCHKRRVTNTNLAAGVKKIRIAAVRVCVQVLVFLQPCVCFCFVAFLRAVCLCTHPSCWC